MKFKTKTVRNCAWDAIQFLCQADRVAIGAYLLWAGYHGAGVTAVHWYEWRKKGGITHDVTVGIQGF